jgi:hypothetical protein
MSLWLRTEGDLLEEDIVLWQTDAYSVWSKGASCLSLSRSSSLVNLPLSSAIFLCRCIVLHFLEWSAIANCLVSSLRNLCTFATLGLAWNRTHSRSGGLRSRLVSFCLLCSLFLTTSVCSRFLSHNVSLCLFSICLSDTVCVCVCVCLLYFCLFLFVVYVSTWLCLSACTRFSPRGLASLYPTTLGNSWRQCSTSRPQRISQFSQSVRVTHKHTRTHTHTHTHTHISSYIDSIMSRI